MTYLMHTCDKSSGILPKCKYSITILVLLTFLLIISETLETQ